MTNPTVSVAIPWHPNVLPWGWLEAWWTTNHPDWEIVQAPMRTWRAAAAVNEAVAATSGDIVVVAYPDAVPTPDWVNGATATVMDGEVIIPKRCAVLGRFETLDLYRQPPTGDLPFDKTGEWDLGPWPGVAVAHRRTFESIPFDERFDVIGFEAAAFLLAARVLTTFGVLAVGDSMRLWSPPRQWRESVRRNRLYERYTAFARERDADAMRELACV